MCFSDGEKSVLGGSHPMVFIPVDREILFYYYERTDSRFDSRGLVW